MAEYSNATGFVQQTEVDLYGNSRLGSTTGQTVGQVVVPMNGTDGKQYTFTRG